MAFSTVTELKNNVKMIENTFTGAGEADTFATERIALADKIVLVDCAKYIDFSIVPDDETTPVVNLLSQYKAACMSLHRITGLNRRTQQNDDIEDWCGMYDELLEKLKNGDLEVELSDGTNASKGTATFTNPARPGIRPSQGYDKYGEWINNDDLYEIRGDVDTRKYDSTGIE